MRLRNIFSDRELWFILAFNLFLAWGYYRGIFSMDTLVWIYYFQSVLIGIGNVFRLGFLRNFNTENFTVNGQPVSPTRATKITTTLFFMFHYGFFHLVYLVFLAVSSTGNGSKIDFRMVMINVMLIAGNTLVSTWSNILQDRDNRPAISSLLFTPYLRVVPMHIFIIIGFTLKTETQVMGYHITPERLFWIFLSLKIFSDSIMHIVIQKSWRGKRIQPIGGMI